MRPRALRNSCRLTAGKRQYSAGQKAKAAGAKGEKQSSSLRGSLSASNRGPKLLSTRAADGGRLRGQGSDGTQRPQPGAIVPCLIRLLKARKEDPVKALQKGQYIKHFQYGLGVITESDEERTSIDFDIHGMKKFVTSLMVVDPAEGTPPKRPRPKRG